MVINNNFLIICEFYFCFIPAIFLAPITGNMIKIPQSESFAINHNQQEHFQLAKYIGDLIKSHFSDCTIIFANTFHNKDFQYADIIQNEFSELSILTNSEDLHMHSFQVQLLSPTFKMPNGYRDIHKVSSYCKLALAYVTPKYSPNYPQAFLDALTPSKFEITKRDSDHYIFLTEDDKSSDTLLHSKISHHLRYKLVLQLTTSNDQSESLTETSHNFKEGKNSPIIKTICIYCPSEKIQQLPIGVPNDLELSSLFPDFTQDFHQHKLRLSGPTKYFATYEMEKTGTGYRNKRGIHTLVFGTVAKKLNISYSVQPCSGFGDIPEGSSGVLLKNGTWAGCVGDVLYNISDMGLSISPGHKRFDYVEFTNAMAYTYVSFITPKPGLYYSWTTIFSALNPNVWALVILSIMLTTGAIYLVNYCHHHNYPRLSNRRKRDNDMAKTGLYVFGYLLAQDFPSPNSGSLSTKIVYLSWLYYGFVIGAIYLCNLQALIVSPRMDVVPRTFSELVHSDFSWGASSGFRGGLGEQLFKSSTNPIMRAIYYKMEGDADELICTARAVKRYACFNWELLQRFQLWTAFADKSGSHPFQGATDTAFFTTLSFITRKREIYLEHFNNFIKNQFDSGLVHQSIIQDWTGYRVDRMKAIREGKETDYSESVKDQRNSEGPRPFGLESVKGSFICLLNGILISIMVLILELVKKHQRKCASCLVTH